MTIKKMEDVMSLVLIIGMMISLLLVISGGVFYLLQYGNELMNYDSVPGNYRTNLKQILASALSFSSFGIIELGIMILVATQAIRVALLVCYYGSIRDGKFFLISLFILSVLVYSLFFRV